jgi:hypothetical protein
VGGQIETAVQLDLRLYAAAVSLFERQMAAFVALTSAPKVRLTDVIYKIHSAHSKAASITGVSPKQYKNEWKKKTKQK